MKQDKNVLLISGSRLLSYPSNQFFWDLKELRTVIEDLVDSDQIKEQLDQVFDSLMSLSRKDLQELYVRSFDLREKTGLYLTAHELGDSTRRGAALIKLQKMINQAGFEREDQELVDYIPMLLEFLSAAPSTNEIERLESRLAVALGRILDNLDEDNPYQEILMLLLEHVFPTPSKEDIEQLENNREEADLEELPYPIMYQ
ncbi:nitrate reductase molybdenum cofactor assembly chaperone [Alkalibacillus aidingensis]|uniref:nitrate reductase molybdenum cofactor assembly chaperone n=1 Tax=Alkalibacillus aidingensis TaxID=2747607 RepID=UPI0016610243|nr:nitrate reductase molybdenum cofactor assembly chaperone [Alkalibacillus aidingensis]